MLENQKGTETKVHRCKCATRFETPISVRRGQDAKYDVSKRQIFTQIYIGTDFSKLHDGNIINDKHASF